MRHDSFANVKNIKSALMVDFIYRVNVRCVKIAEVAQGSEKSYKFKLIFQNGNVKNQFG